MALPKRKDGAHGVRKDQKNSQRPLAERQPSALPLHPMTGSQALRQRTPDPAAGAGNQCCGPPPPRRDRCNGRPHGQVPDSGPALRYPRPEAAPLPGGGSPPVLPQQSWQDYPAAQVARFHGTLASERSAPAGIREPPLPHPSAADKSALAPGRGGQSRSRRRSLPACPAARASPTRHRHRRSANAATA